MFGKYPGQRLSFDDSLCTVRFCGRLPDQQGDWLGVEWDDHQRGKHNGYYKGRQLFETLSQSPNCASFIRATRHSDEPRSFLEALRYKYADERVEGPPDGSVRISGKVVEEVGFERVRRQQAVLDRLRIVVLDGLRIRGIGLEQDVRNTQDEIASTCPNITELDLSRNLFEDWRNVADVCAPLERLRCLKVSGLRFRGVDAGVAFRCPNLEELHLNDCLLQPGHILAMLCRHTQSDSTDVQFPSLRTLSIAGNNLSSFNRGEARTVAPVFETVNSLILESNMFTSFVPVCKSLLPLFPNLNILSLQHNQISRFTAGWSAAEQSVPVYSSVTSLNLSHNAITSPQFISSLSVIFPNLSSLRVSGNPFFMTTRHPSQRTQDAVFMLTLARLPTLNVLNHSNITEKDRMDVELYYVSVAEEAIKQAFQRAESKEQEGNRRAMCQEWPRYEELCTKYERDNVLEQLAHTQSQRSNNEVSATGTLQRKYSAGSLHARLVAITFQLVSADDGQSNDKNDQTTNKADRTLTLTLPRIFDVYRVKGLLLRKIGRDWGLQPLDFVFRLVHRRKKRNRPRSDEDDDDDIPMTRPIPEKAEEEEEEEEIPDSTRKISDWIVNDDDDDDGAAIQHCWVKVKPRSRSKSVEPDLDLTKLKMAMVA